MAKKILSLFSLIFIVLIAFAQNGKISGKVLNAKNEGLPGVSVKLIGVAGGATTDIEGRYNLNLPIGKKFTIEFSAVGYDSKSVDDVEASASQITELIIVLDVTSKNLGEVTVRASRTNLRKESTNSLIQFQKNTNTVASVISAESIRRSPDRNTGEVLKRIPGASVQEGKYLVVRGLSDRYNFAMLNGIPLSSTEPDRKTFSFDIFPASLVDNIIINKAFVPELPGEWAGGLVQVNTKDIPSSSFLNITLGTGFNTQTIGEDFYTYKGGKLDWLGIDDGIRGLPGGLPTKSDFSALSRAEKTAYGKQFSDIWAADKNSSLGTKLNKKFELTGGFNSSLGGNKMLGVTYGITYNQSVRRTVFGNSIFLTDPNTLPSATFEYDNEKYAKDVLWGGLANFALKLGNNSKISFKNIININSTNYTTLRNGLDFNSGGNGAPIQASELAMKSNTFFNTQLSGDHNLTSAKTKIHWYGSFNILDQYIPDQRRLLYNQETVGGPFLAAITPADRSQIAGSRYYGFLNDYIYNVGGDINKSFTLFGRSQSVKAGYLFQVKDRLFDSRPFAIYMPVNNPSLRQLSPAQIFAAENFGNGADNKFAFNELDGDQFRYMANSILNAAFIQFDNEFTEKLRATWGVRMEDYDQLIGSVKKSDPRHVHTQVRDFLPGVNITYKVTKNNNLRLSGSQTVIRPEFRELSTFQFFDFDLNATAAGNPGLVRTKVTNADLRFEMYPRSGEVFTVGVFYKYFRNPIEVFLNVSSGGGSSYNYINAESATGYGVEVEFRKKLDFSEALKNFTFQTNASYIYNRVKSAGNSLDRPMQGQSPYVLNASLQYDVEKLGLYTTLLYNQVGDRIAFVGGGDQLPIWEATRPLFDLQVAKKIMKNKAEIKLNVSDILNKTANFYNDMNGNSKYDKGTDALAIDRKFGQTINLSFSYTIK